MVEESDKADLMKAFGIVLFALPLGFGVIILLLPMLDPSIDTTAFIGIALFCLGLAGLIKK